MICPSCDTETAPGSRFCNHCGAPLPVAAPSQDETRLVTVLFADMSGSVGATEGLDPETAVERVNEALEIMSTEVIAHGGRVDRYLGDGVLALFGAPRASEDDPQRAIAAALAMVARVRARGCDLTVGINTGETYIGRVGSDAHRERTVMGPVVNLAARLQGSCAPGEIVAGESTWRLTRRAFEFEPREVAIKGLGEPVSAYRVIRARPRPEQARGLEGLRAELVGRELELDRLTEALDRAHEGEGRAVTVVGEAGVGKTSLVAAVRRLAEARADDSLWLEGRCLESTASTRYAPFVDLLRQRFDPAGGLACVDAVGEELATLADEGALAEDRIEDVLVPLLDLLSLPDPRVVAFGELPPHQVKSRTFLALLSYLSALASRRVLILLLDDLHWADSLTLELVPRLVQSLMESRALLLCVQRPSQEHASRHLVSLVARHAAGRHVDLQLLPLDHGAARRLVFELLGGDGLTEPAVGAILDKAQGNPLFLEEILRALLSSGQIERDGAAVRVSPNLRLDEVPTTIQSIIQSRVDRIEEEPRRVLQGAAVIGPLFPRGLLEAVIERGTDLDRALWHLEQHELVYLDRAVPEEVYSFHHVFTRDTVYRSLLKRRREELHRAVGRAIEASYPDRLEEHVEALAYHYDRAADADRAVQFLFRAAEKSRRAHLNEEAAASFHRVLTRLEEAADGESTSPLVELRARAHESLGDVLERMGRHDEAVDSFELALRDRSLRETVARGRILRKAGLARQVQRRREEAIEMFDRAVEALGGAPQPPDPAWDEERSAIELGKIMVEYFTSSVEVLADRIERSRPVVEERGTAFQRAWLYNSLALFGLRRERYLASDATVEYARAGYESARAEPARVEIQDIHFSYGFCLLWSGRLDEAETHLLETLAEAERTGYATIHARCVTYLTLIARRRGDVQAVREWAERALRVARDGGMPEYIASAEAHLAWAALRRGDLDEAEPLARRAFAAFRQSGGPYRVLAWIAAWPLLGVELARGNLTPAVEIGRQLLEDVTQPAPPAVAEVLSEGVAAAGRGDEAGARERLTEAVRRARPHGFL